MTARKLPPNVKGNMRLVVRPILGEPDVAESDHSCAIVHVVGATEGAAEGAVCDVGDQATQRNLGRVGLCYLSCPHSPSLGLGEADGSLSKLNRSIQAGNLIVQEISDPPLLIQ